MQFKSLVIAESYAKNSSKKHNNFRYVFKSNHIASYYVYESMDESDGSEVLVSIFKKGEKI